MTKMDGFRENPSLQDHRLDKNNSKVTSEVTSEWPLEDLIEYVVAEKVRDLQGFRCK